jgi:hypothetical protein
VNEHEFEPVPGLPERLPEGERMLWQGAPSWQGLALRALHARKVALYFAALATWHVYETVARGTPWLVAVRGTTWLLILGAVCVTVLAVLAWAMARSTIYTITSKRVVMRFGVALPMTVNLPLRVVESAGIVRHRDGTADLPLALTAGQRVGYLLNWPHVRPWRYFRVQPTLRALADGDRVAGILGGALTATEPVTSAAATRPAAREAQPESRSAATAAA